MAILIKDVKLAVVELPDLTDRFLREGTLPEWYHAREVVLKLRSIIWRAKSVEDYPIKQNWIEWHDEEYGHQNGINDYWTMCNHANKAFHEIYEEYAVKYETNSRDQSGVKKRILSYAKQYREER